MANTTTYIDKLVIPNGSDTITANLVDTVSGYTKPEIFIVTLSLTAGDDFEADTSYSDIQAAIDDRKFVILVDSTYHVASTEEIYAPYVCTEYDHDSWLHFERIGAKKIYDYTISDSDQVSCTVTYIAESSHTHGNISNNGGITSDTAVATGDKLVITDDSSAYSSIARSPISFDTTVTTTFLRRDGSWATPPAGSSTDVQINGTSITSSGTANILTNSTYNSSSNKIATMSDVKGSDVLLVTLSYSNSTYSIDSTYDDILQAVSDGKFVYLYDAVSSWSYSSDGGFIIAPLSFHYPFEPAESEYYLYFVSSYTTGGNISFCRYSVDYNDGVLASDSIGVTSATSATNSTNATNAYVTKTNPTSSTTYYATFVSSDSSSNQGQKENDGFKYMSLQGTTSANGYGILRLGNTTNSGTAGNKYGAVDIYPKTGAYYGRLITADTLGGNRTYTLPNATGTIALTSDIPSVPNVLTGTTAPTSTQGSDGDIYIRY